MIHRKRTFGSAFVTPVSSLLDDSPTVLVQGEVSDPEAVIMRGRVTRYELVVDSGRIDRNSVKVLTRS